MKISKLPALIAASVLACAPALAQVPATVPSPTRTAPVASVAPAPEGPVGARPAGRLAAGQPIPPAELEAFVDGVIRDAMATDHVSGATVAVVQGGKPILIKGYGMAAPDRAVDPARDLFRIASVSKTFTWILLMREVEAGRMKLEDPINRYLPPDMQIPDQGFHKPIRLIDLMGHAGGFEDSALGHLFAADPGRVTALGEYLKGHRPNRIREAGTYSTYCNWCVALVGYAVARSAGAPDFDTLADRDLFQPLGMTSTTYRQPYPARAGIPAPMPADLARRLSKGFAWTGSGFAPAPFEFGSIDPAGSISTTAPDMARYMLMQLAGGSLDGNTVYGPATAKAFRTPVMDVPPGVNGWAHGFQRLEMPGGFVAYGHGGALSNYFTNMLVVPELDLGVFISTNTNTGRPLVDRLPNHIVARFYAPVQDVPLTPDPGLVARAAVYDGSYLGSRRSYTGLEGFVYLFFSVATVKVDPAGYLLVTAGDATRQYRPDGRPHGFVSTDGRNRVTFKVENGKAVSFEGASGTQTFERAPVLKSPDMLNLAMLLGLSAAFLTIFGAFTRRGQDVRPSPAQRSSNLLSLGAATAFLGATALFGKWAESASGYDNSYFYNWPGPLVLGGSWLALLGALMTLGMIVLLPLTWRPARGAAGGWTIWRKLRHTLGVFSFAVFAGVLAVWGALQPWAA
ncbi:MAG: serine hydrolase [Caulobacteraceae bacterium]|nr:serine hydrolase [Caulobacteraceae bacterium]